MSVVGRLRRLALQIDAFPPTVIRPFILPERIRDECFDRHLRANDVHAAIVGPRGYELMFKMKTLSIGVDLHVGSAAQLHHGERFCFPRQLRYRSVYVLHRCWANETECWTGNACVHVFSSDIEEDVRVWCRRSLSESNPVWLSGRGQVLGLAHGCARLTCLAAVHPRALAEVGSRPRGRGPERQLSQHLKVGVSPGSL
jgi:hypothetical protein